MDNGKTQRISFRAKNANKKAWYKEQLDLLDTGSTNSSGILLDSVAMEESAREFLKNKANYDLFNNILNLEDFDYVCHPAGMAKGELPAKMVNRDIVSGKIKAMLGMEMKRPFSWAVVATNPEATTRKEEEEFSLIKDYVIEQIMKPIKDAAAKNAKAQQAQQQQEQTNQGGQASPQQAGNSEIDQQNQQQIAEDVKAKTPEQVKKYMKREHQDPVELMTQHLLKYLTSKENLKHKLNMSFKHALLSSKEVLYVGILNGEPKAWVINSLRFDCENSPDREFIEDAEWAHCDYEMSPTEIIGYFGDELTDADIDQIYLGRGRYGQNRSEYEDFFSAQDEPSNDNSLSVMHGVWKSLRKIGFLTYEDEHKQEQEILVDENYKLNVDFGDIEIDWRWIPEVYEGWKIKTGEPIYVNMRPIPGQFKDLDNLYHCKLPYYGAIYDNMNSESTSLMDRLKPYQYFYNIIMYRIETLMASDKGKKILLNVNSIPDSANFGLEKWKYYFESSPFMFFDNKEEGNTYSDANTLAKEIDLSLVSDISKYIDLAENLKRQAGLSVGITEEVEGQIANSATVRNTQQNLVQTSHILEPYFELHNMVKTNFLQGLLETAKVAYANGRNKKLTYVLDDLSRELFNLDVGLLENSTLGIFIADSSRAEELKETIKNLSLTAMQNQKIELSDTIKILREDNVIEAEETLAIAEDTRREQSQQMEKDKMKQAQDMQEQMHKMELEKFQQEKEIIILTAEENRKTDIAKAYITAASFNPDLDKDQDGVNDYIQLAKQSLDEEVKRAKIEQDGDKLQHQKGVDNEKLKQNQQKLNQDKEKMQMDKQKQTDKTATKV